MAAKELLIKAKDQKAEQILFIVGQDPLMKVAGQWQKMRGTPGLASEWQQWQELLLTPAQKDNVESQGSFSGESFCDGLRLNCHFFSEDNTFKVAIELWQTGVSRTLPQVLTEGAQNFKGLHIWSGQGTAGITQAWELLLSSVSRPLHIVSIGSSNLPFNLPQHNLIQQGISGEGFRPELIQGVDLLLLRHQAGLPTLLMAVEFAEMGIPVWLELPAVSVANALDQYYSELQVWGTAGARRLAAVIDRVIYQVQLEGLAGDKHWAHEYILAHSQIKKLIANGDMNTLEQMTLVSPEGGACVGLNQSLLQHLLRRRIDLKTAFLASKDPEHLDQLLKKVGI